MLMQEKCIKLSKSSEGPVQILSNKASMSQKIWSGLGFIVANKEQ